MDDHFRMGIKLTRWVVGDGWAWGVCMLGWGLGVGLWFSFLVWCGGWVGGWVGGGGGLCMGVKLTRCAGGCIAVHFWFP